MKIYQYSPAIEVGFWPESGYEYQLRYRMFQKNSNFSILNLLPPQSTAIGWLTSQRPLTAHCRPQWANWHNWSTDGHTDGRSLFTWVHNKQKLFKSFLNVYSLFFHSFPLTISLTSNALYLLHITHHQVCLTFSYLCLNLQTAHGDARQADGRGVPVADQGADTRSTTGTQSISPMFVRLSLRVCVILSVSVL